MMVTVMEKKKKTGALAAFPSVGRVCLVEGG
jgi:hypothetical protein